MRVLVIGAGMSGMLMGIRLLEAGIESFEILEKAASVGGTWRENTYPGLACDVPAYLYTYSFEPNPECSHRYARGPEIQAYFERVFEKHGLARYTRFGREVEAARWEDGAWTVTTKDGERRRADVLVAATGVLHHPKLPDIPGLDSFEGAAFHSARWDHRAPLDGSRIGVVGTGSTAVQIVSALADRASKLSLFQRTAQWVLPAFDADYGESSKAILRRFPSLARLLHHGYAAYFDGVLGGGFGTERRLFFAAFETLAERHLATVRDPELRRKLTPDYRLGCKRFILSDRFYEAIQGPHSELVTEGIERVEARGVRTRDGRLHELDVLVLATGFHARAFMRPMAIEGVDGTTLESAWADGVYAHRSVALPAFPNFFMLQGPNSPIGNYSLIKIAEIQSAYVMAILERIRRGELATVMPRKDVTDRLARELREAAEHTVWKAAGCTSWYLDERGNLGVWPFTLERFGREMRTPRFEELELDGPATLSSSMRPGA
ncbi:MAG: NAD(P)/FAD-dependent oxidoreductase [Polyangiales bacterium]